MRPPNPILAALAPGLFYATQTIPKGIVTPGNIDLAHRPVVHNPDGSISTVRSVSFRFDNGHAVLLPTVIGGQVVSEAAALQHYRKTGQHLGIFRNEALANAYSQQLHNSQAAAYGPGTLRR